jgi:hypothetical protein
MHLLIMLAAGTNAAPHTYRHGGATTCNHTIDVGAVRAGMDYKCSSDNETLGGCVAACCASDECHSFSFNDPWNMTGWNGCVQGLTCCCLKSGVPPLEPNTWPMKITTGVMVSLSWFQSFCYPSISLSMEWLVVGLCSLPHVT